ncbi:MAG: cytochrome C [Flavobacteriales bacterium]|nr:cytochrome C [Flavobacteriales bacterium]MBK7942758.1 cytochrome C [Flavobacteriales bacterium]MBK9698842.1 cytochrome C [Flavobacteriales bacterium]
MKRLIKILGALLVLLAVVVGAGLLYLTKALPDVDAPTDLKVELTPERIERGRYLANSVCVCMDCHAQRDWSLFAGPPKPGTLGAGGDKFDRTMQFPGEFFARNITPFALKDWTDGELYRAITSGVSKDGHPFFPVMPFPNYNRLATEDVHSIIAYLRSIDPVSTPPWPESTIDFPVNLIMRTVPQPAQPMDRPAPTGARYGEYVTNAAACIECHTNTVKGERVGQPFAGGFTFAFPDGSVLRSPNITPHPTDGIGAWDKAMFIARFKQYADSAYAPATVAPGDFQTVMPWTMYATMTEEDLGAIYDHLAALPPVAGRVEKWTPAP